MTDLKYPLGHLLEALDGFRVEIDADRKRAEVQQCMQLTSTNRLSGLISSKFFFEVSKLFEIKKAKFELVHSHKRHTPVTRVGCLKHTRVNGSQ